MTNGNYNTKLLKLKKELELRKYSKKTIKKYMKIIEKFLNSGKTAKEFIFLYTKIIRA